MKRRNGVLFIYLVLLFFFHSFSYNYFLLPELALHTTDLVRWPVIPGCTPRQCIYNYIMRNYRALMRF